MIKNNQLTLALGHRSAFGLEDFLVAPSNENAVNWLDKYPEWSSFALAIHGEESCGKSHLAHVFKTKAGKNTSIIQSTELVLDAVPELLKQSKNVAVEVSEEPINEEALFHLFNAIKENGGFLLLTARKPPARWNVKLPDLRSRLSTIPTVEIYPPDDALISAVLVKLFSDRQIRVGEEVINFLLHNMERSFAAAKIIVEKSDVLALSSKKKITVHLVREVLKNLD